MWPPAVRYGGFRLRTLGVATAILVALCVAFDPFTYAIFLSYDVIEYVWWKPALAALDAGLILAAAVLLWRRNAVTASRVAFADIALAATLGLAIGHGDLIRIALAGWIPAQILLLLYFVTLLLRILVCAAALSDRSRAGAPAT
jgi:hypothetical protein